MHDRGKIINQKYEMIFCIFLVVLAFLYRDNPYLVYPQILYLFILLLTLNLLAGLTLRWWPHQQWVSALLILANCATITGILEYSGNSESNLWVLFLLPIYTVCLLLEAGAVVCITLGVISFNWAFHRFSADYWDTSDTFSIGLKSGLFIFAAAATWAIVRRDRQAQERLNQQRQEVQELEEKVREQGDNLVHAEKLADIGQLTSGVAHDINNPITVILGTVKMMLEEQQLGTMFFQDLQRIQRSAELCQTIAANLLGFVKQNEFQLVSCNINDVLEAALSIYGSTLTQNSIKLEKDFSTSLPRISGSVQHLERVFLNLMSNSRSAMKAGGTLTIKTQILESKSGGNPSMVQIVIEDTGPGISEEAMTKLFKPFNTTKGPEGTGLGLYLSREILKNHKGSLEAANRPEGGARFTVRLPIEKAGQLAA